MKKIEEFVPGVRKATREAFIEANGLPFLVLYRDEGESKQEWSFKTATISSKHINLSQMADEDGVALSKDAKRYRIFSLVKSAGSPWLDRISVGRARNNDISLPHNSVSKLHAHFSNGEGGQVMLSDAGSRNGTRINSERILDSNPVLTEPGDLITFGGIPLTHVDAGGLYDLVTKLIDEGPGA